jgi:putative exporter of polyketide antibiotics
MTVWLAGCVEIAGAVATALMVRIAALLAAFPALLLTATANLALLSEVVSAGVVYVDDVAPLIATAFLLHW